MQDLLTQTQSRTGFLTETGQLLQFFVTKLSYAGASLFFVITVSFFLMKALPGDPFSEEMPLPPEIHKAIRSHYGLDQPVPMQYIRYLTSLAHGNLGPSYKFKNRSVNSIIAEFFPVSAFIGLAAMLLAFVQGTISGVATVYYKNAWPEKPLIFLCLIGLSIPGFLLAALLQYLLGYQLGLFPVARIGTAWHYFLPVISLAAFPSAFISRIVKVNLEDLMRQDFFKSAQAKGFSTLHILTRKCLKLTLLPVFSYLGQLAASVLTGSFIVEKIFAIPGLGYWFVASVANRDYTVILGTTIVYSTVLISFVFFMDMLSCLVDPRIRNQMLRRRE